MAEREAVVLSMVGREREARRRAEAELGKEATKRLSIEQRLAQALTSLAETSALLSAERQARERSEAVFGSEREARVAAEAARARAEAMIESRDAEISRLAKGPTPVIQMVKPNEPWDFEVRRDGADNINRIIATPRKPNGV